MKAADVGDKLKDMGASFRAAVRRLGSDSNKGSPQQRAREAITSVEEWSAKLDDRGEAVLVLHRACAEARRLIEEPPLIGLLGQFSTGKSSVVNALIGEDLALVDATATTARPTYFRSGAERRIRVHRGEDVEEVSLADFKLLAHASAGGDPKTLEGITRIVVEHPSKTLRSLVIVDTPGFSASGTTGSNDDAAALDALKEVSAVVWLVDINKGALHESDVAALKKVKAAGHTTFLVLNKADSKPPSDRVSIRQAVTRPLPQELRPTGVFTFSATLRSKREQGHELSPRMTEGIDMDWEQEVLQSVRDSSAELMARRSRQGLTDALYLFALGVDAEIKERDAGIRACEVALKKLPATTERAVNKLAARLAEGLQKEVAAMGARHAGELVSTVKVDEGFFSNDYAFKDKKVLHLINALWADIAELAERWDGIIEEEVDAHHRDVLGVARATRSSDLLELVTDSGFDGDQIKTCLGGIAREARGMLKGQTNGALTTMSQVAGAENVSGLSRADAAALIQECLCDAQETERMMFRWVVGDADARTLSGDAAEPRSFAEFWMREVWEAVPRYKAFLEESNESAVADATAARDLAGALAPKATKSVNHA